MRLARNPDFLAATAELDRLGLPWRVLHGGKHPYLLIAGRAKFTLASSPRPGMRKHNAVLGLRRTLRRFALIED